MAHANGEVYHHLGHKIDGLQVRTPWNQAFGEMLAALYSPEEADLVTKMPYGLGPLEEVEKVTRYPRVQLQRMLEELCIEGLVMDVCVQGTYYYMVSPMVVGIFEMTMMRTDPNLPMKQWAGLLDRYMHGDDTFYGANSEHGERVSVMRTLPHTEAVLPSVQSQVLDYEKAAAIVDENELFSIGLCSCRNEKQLNDKKKCAVPLETCSAFGSSADYLIRRGFSRKVSKTEMQENLARSKELKLVLTSDNVQKHVGFICHCCKCCCNLLLGVTGHGHPEILTTSSFISKMDEDKCTGCGRCVDPCPVNAIQVVPGESKRSRRGKTVKIDEELCIGCGVCGLVCALDGIHLVPRAARVLHPETTFERILLMCLERGNLQNMLFTNPSSITQSTMRAIIGGFLRLPPVKQKLMSDEMRSSFLETMRTGVRMQGKGWLLDF